MKIIRDTIESEERAERAEIEEAIKKAERAKIEEAIKKAERAERRARIPITMPEKILLGLEPMTFDQLPEVVPAKRYKAYKIMCEVNNRDIGPNSTTLLRYDKVMKVYEHFNFKPLSIEDISTLVVELLDEPEDDQTLNRYYRTVEDMIDNGILPPALVIGV